MRIRRPDRAAGSRTVHGRQGGGRPRRHQVGGGASRVAALLVAGCAAGACALLERPPPTVAPLEPAVVASEPIPVAGFGPEVALDTLALSMSSRAETLPVESLPALEVELRDWLARLEYRDPALIPMDVAPEPFFRLWSGRLLDALGVSARRRGDLRQAEAALRSAEAELHERGTTRGYARHWLHLGDVLAERRRWSEAAAAYLAAETRGVGAEATPALEVAWRRAGRSAAALERARADERAAIEDERRQAVVAALLREPLPAFSWPRRTGPPLTAADLAGRPAVIVAWGPGCCPGLRAALDPFAERLAGHGATLVGVWLGPDAAGAGPPAGFPVAVPADPAATRRRLRLGPPPTLLVVDAAGRIRYRHAGTAAEPLPVDDVLLQVDHLERRRTGSAAPAANPAREVR